jgi:hypothetical protein
MSFARPNSKQARPASGSPRFSSTPPNWSAHFKKPDPKGKAVVRIGGGPSGPLKSSLRPSAEPPPNPARQIASSVLGVGLDRSEDLSVQRFLDNLCDQFANVLRQEDELDAPSFEKMKAEIGSRLSELDSSDAYFYTFVAELFTSARNISRHDVVQALSEALRNFCELDQRLTCAQFAAVLVSNSPALGLAQHLCFE